MCDAGSPFRICTYILSFITAASYQKKAREPPLYSVQFETTQLNDERQEIITKLAIFKSRWALWMRSSWKLTLILMDERAAIFIFIFSMNEFCVLNSCSRLMNVRADNECATGDQVWFARVFFCFLCFIFHFCSGWFCCCLCEMKIDTFWAICVLPTANCAKKYSDFARIKSWKARENGPTIFNQRARGLSDNIEWMDGMSRVNSECEAR